MSTWPYPSDEHDKIVRYLETYAANIRRELRRGKFEVDPRVLRKAHVGKERRAAVRVARRRRKLAAVAAGVARGVHLSYRRRGETVAEPVLVARYMRSRGFFAAIEVAHLIEAGAHMEAMT